jgi:hypothetical protein
LTKKVLMKSKQYSIGKSELAQLLGITQRSLYSKLMEIGIKNRNKLLMPIDLQKIDEFIGLPEEVAVKLKQGS